MMRRLSPEEQDAMVRDYAGGMKVEAIALMHRCAISTVSRAVRRAGLQLRRVRRNQQYQAAK